MQQAKKLNFPASSEAKEGQKIDRENSGLPLASGTGCRTVGWVRQLQAETGLLKEMVVKTKVKGRKQVYLWSPEIGRAHV